MSRLSYIREYYPLPQFFIFLFTCICLGCIPALQITVEQGLMDAAILGVSGGALQEFYKYIGLFVALMLYSQVLVSLLQREKERHFLVVGKKLDQERLKKTDKISFSITETEEFHKLYACAEKAAELDETYYGALQTKITGFLQIALSFLVIFSIDRLTAIVLLVLLLSGIVISHNAAGNTESFWGEYIENMRHANYLASLLLHREYAAERKIFQYDSEIEDRYRKDFSAAVEKNDRLGKRRLYSDLGTNLFSIIYSILTILLLTWPLYRGSITLGAAIAIFTAANRLRSVSNLFYDALFSSWSSYRQLSGFFSFLQLEEEEEHRSDQQIRISEGIEFRNVSFTYPGSATPVLDNISFQLQTGVHYALVGENGSGKTTLVKLLLGLYQPTQGCILVGGKDIKEMVREERRQLFSVIFQDFYRYPLSVRENVSLGNEKLRETDEIKSILEKLQLDAPFLTQEKGMDVSLHLLQKESVDLSGGEWQKLTVARSVLSPAPIVVLDEPNAALDPMSEAAFYRVYEELLASKTTLFISHRLGAVKSADSILVLHDRHLIAMGSHDVLMRTCDCYREMFETQRGLYYGTKAS